MSLRIKDFFVFMKLLSIVPLVGALLNLRCAVTAPELSSFCEWFDSSADFGFDKPEFLRFALLIDGYLSGHRGVYIAVIGVSAGLIECEGEDVAPAQAASRQTVRRVSPVGPPRLRGRPVSSGFHS